METIFTDLVLKFKLLVLASSEEIGADYHSWFRSLNQQSRKPDNLKYLYETTRKLNNSNNFYF